MLISPFPARDSFVVLGGELDEAGNPGLFHNGTCVCILNSATRADAFSLPPITVSP
jgi:hypothetical protein